VVIKGVPEISFDGALSREPDDEGSLGDDSTGLTKTSTSSFSTPSIFPGCSQLRPSSVREWVPATAIVERLGDARYDILRAMKVKKKGESVG